MSFAQDIIAKRIQDRTNAAREQVSEASRVNLERYNAEQLRQQIIRERAELQSQEDEILRERDALTRQLDMDSGIAVEDAPCSAPQTGVAPPVASRVITGEKWWRLLGRPWSVQWRFVLIFGAVACVILGLLMRSNPEIHWLYAAAMAACVPCTVCVFFAELARRMDLKWPWVLATYLIGGIASILMTLFVNQCATFLPRQAVWAGVVEEPCKGAVLLVVLVAFPRIRGVLSGLALGAAVGAGFASIETFGYGYRFGSNDEPSTLVLVYRGVLAPMMHTGWTAALGGALWYIRYQDGLPLFAMRCWYAVGVFTLMVVCHCVWNSGNSVGYFPLIVWVLIFFYARKGTSEMRLLGREWPA